MKNNVRLVFLWVACVLGFNVSGQHIVNPIQEVIERSHLVLNLETFVTIPDGSGYNRARINMIREFPDESGRMFVIDLNGFLHLVQEDGTRSLYINFHDQFENFISSPGLGTGAGAVAIHPDFANNGFFYTAHAESAGAGAADYSPNEGSNAMQWVITKWVVEDLGATAFSGSSSEVFRVDFPGFIHGMQDISFNPFALPEHSDYGLLYVCHGDGASSETGLFGNVGTNESHVSAILRIDPEGSNSTSGKYGIPLDNPFYGDADAVKEVWAYGFRNPHRLSFEVRGEDTLLFVGDIGHHKIEEINLVEKGGNYGWDRREGTFVHDRDDSGRGILPLTEEDTIPYIYPVAQYDHGEGAAIALGHTWTATTQSSLQGQMFFADILYGRVFHLPLDSLLQGRQYTIQEALITMDGGNTTTFDNITNGRVDLRMARSLAGELMLFTKSNGRIYKITGVDGGADEVPEAIISSFSVLGQYAPMTVYLDGALSTGTELTYHWNFGDGEFATEAEVSHVYTDPGNYKMKFYVKNTFGTASDTVDLSFSVLQNPKAVILLSDSVGKAPKTIYFDARTSIVDASGSASYEWNFGDGNPNPPTNGFVSGNYTHNGKYQVILKVYDGINKTDYDTAYIHLDDSYVLSTSGLTGGIELFPNPVTSDLQVKLPMSGKVELIDLEGRIISSGYNTAKEHFLNMGNLKSGIYIINIQMGDEVFSERVIKR